MVEDIDSTPVVMIVEFVVAVVGIGVVDAVAVECIGALTGVVAAADYIAYIGVLIGVVAADIADIGALIGVEVADAEDIVTMLELDRSYSYSGGTTGEKHLIVAEWGDDS